MRGLEKVWVYVDGVAPIHDPLAAGIEAARRSGARLELVSAIGRFEDRRFQAPSGPALLRVIRNERAAWLRDLELIARSSLGPRRVRATLLEGEVPWQSLVRHAAVKAPDLLVVPARDRDPRRDPATRQLFRTSPVPVWSVRAPAASFPRRLLAAVDPGAAGSPERALARRVLQLAVRLAAGGPLELHLAHAVPEPGAGLLGSRFATPGARAQAAEARALARERLGALLAEGGVEATVHVVAEPPSRAIPALAARLGADLVALGGARRTGDAGPPLAWAADGIVARLDCSVAVVNAEGVASPVRLLAEPGAPRAA
jgi:nucleotide-binding universal stress UspA family protein